MNRDFDDWLKTFRKNIFTYDYFTNFAKIYDNVDNIKVELSILNSLVGSKNIKDDFTTIVNQYPQVIKCIPILLAKRTSEIYLLDEEEEYVYDFLKIGVNGEDYSVFMEQTGLFYLIENRIINNLVDYVTGVEVGLDSNGRKNRTGHIMEDIVEGYVQNACNLKNADYEKEMTADKIQNLWGCDLSALTNQGKTIKRFDFAIKTNEKIYAIETNFYTGSGSKLNETARSYKYLFLASNNISGFEFIWITDGPGWKTTRHNLEETFDVANHLYNLNDLQNGILEEVIK